jgi:hypothetical protein
MTISNPDLLSTFPAVKRGLVVIKEAKNIHNLVLIIAVTQFEQGSSNTSPG